MENESTVINSIWLKKVIPSFDIKSRNFTCKSLKEKRAFKVFLLDSMKNVEISSLSEKLLDFTHVDEDIAKVRMLALKVSKQLINENLNREERLNFSRARYDFLKDKCYVASKSIKGGSVYEGLIDKERWYTGRYLYSLFFEKKSFPIFVYTSKDHNTIVKGYNYYGITICEVKNFGKEKIFIDSKESLLGSYDFIKEVINFVLKKKVSNDLISQVENTLKDHANYLRRFARTKLVMLLEYENEVCDYDEVRDIVIYLKGYIPFEKWPRDIYRIVSDLFRANFDEEHNSDYLKKIIKDYFCKLRFIK